MDMNEWIQKRIRARRQILFSRDDPCIQILKNCIDCHTRKAVISWALSLAEETVLCLEQKYPQDSRARNALHLTWLWARGQIKMPVAKAAILACHAAAKEIDNPEDIAHYHAIGQACATVHTSRHAIGYPIYELTAIIRKNGSDNCQELVSQTVSYYIDHLEYWENAVKDDSEWANFIY